MRGCVKVVFWSSDKARERVVAREFMRGVTHAGDDAEIRSRSKFCIGDYDVAVVAGIKSRESVVLSPPGIIRPSSPSRCSFERTCTTVHGIERFCAAASGDSRPM